MRNRTVREKQPTDAPQVQRKCKESYGLDNGKILVTKLFQIGGDSEM